MRSDRSLVKETTSGFFFSLVVFKC